MKKQKSSRSGTHTDWYEPRNLTESEREVFRKRSTASQLASLAAKRGEGPKSIHPIYKPNFDPNLLMPQCPSNGLTALSLFSGGGGFDLGFDLAGYKHVSSYELLDFAAETIKKNRPGWRIYGGDQGDVTKIKWSDYVDNVDVIHGGPPCQPFSTAGRQKGKNDSRDMFPEFVRAVQEIKPLAFVAENVKGLATTKFSSYIEQTILRPLNSEYEIRQFLLNAADFGVPQGRVRLVFLGLHKDKVGKIPSCPSPTHDPSRFKNKTETTNTQSELFVEDSLPQTMGVREALGLPEIGYDSLCPTLRCSLTGPRGTTSILSSTAALKVWNQLMVWPNGVSATRDRAQHYPAKKDHYRLSLEEVALLQGFPNYWKFEGAVHKSLGQIGNSVAPPKAYRIAMSITDDITSSN